MKARKNTPVHSIVVDVDGELLISSNGHVSGPYALKKEAEENALLGMFVQLTYQGEHVRADLTPGNNVGNAAALLSVSPGRAKFLEIPEDVQAFIDSDRAEHAEGYVETMLEGQDDEETR